MTNSTRSSRFCCVLLRRTPAADDEDRLQLSRDICSILGRIRELQHAMEKQKEEICRYLEDKNQFTEKLVYWQEQKGALTAQYDELFESFNLILDSERMVEMDNEATATDAFRLRSVSRQLTALSLQVKECDMTLQQIERNITEGLQSRRRVVVSGRFGRYEYAANVTANPVVATDQASLGDSGTMWKVWCLLQTRDVNEKEQRHFPKRCS